MSMTLWVPFLIISMVGTIIANDLMEGKIKTDRTVKIETTVDCSRAEVFQLWTSREGVKMFFAPDAQIEPVEGGVYTILFAPKEDPQGLSHGTKGARILKMIPDKFIAFEWITFAADGKLGKDAPPLASPELRNAVPLPTWVELSFEPVMGESGKTHVKLAHYGFREGKLWEESFQWFSRAWKGVLDQLALYCRDRKAM